MYNTNFDESGISFLSDLHVSTDLKTHTTAKVSLKNTKQNGLVEKTKKRHKIQFDMTRTIHNYFRHNITNVINENKTSY